jgi:uncharacterized protein
VSARFLLDVNVLVAMAWPQHVAHEKVLKWLSRKAAPGWATCPLTQAAFVRILSNRAFSSKAVHPEQAVALLQSNLAHPAHQFWTDEIDLATALKLVGQQLTGHQQVNDAYLLGLALHKGAKLATLDHAMVTLAGKQHGEEAVELL